MKVLPFGLLDPSFPKIKKKKLLKYRLFALLKNKLDTVIYSEHLQTALSTEKLRLMFKHLMIYVPFLLNLLSKRQPLPLQEFKDSTRNQNTFPCHQ